ncbi:hypothetical protein B0H67DRAFT_591644 [Lasiosphaeris hirsuta]|uniref:Uncharacterized protein n=1 Tax=Lasiosphaeris hirsuta TaxID=260670 RepID=A0AA40DKW9_9PEZI|nr:hypothetical protein B0H67DRAFT_591644 [Lasiosphaeris hirsuta]
MSALACSRHPEKGVQLGVGQALARVLDKQFFDPNPPIFTASSHVDQVMGNAFDHLRAAFKQAVPLPLLDCHSKLRELSTFTG